MSNILILGGDGYLGWPTAMHLSAQGHVITVVDNYFRRDTCQALNVSMLYAVPSLPERAKVWFELTGKQIYVCITDLADPKSMRSLFNGTAEYQGKSVGAKTVPDTIIHYAEQPSAPFSMMNHQSADTTIVNNLRVTNNLMWAVRDLANEAHIIKLGTMGEYGTPDIDIEEGWIEINHKGRKDKFLFPRQGGSIYHTSKIMDTDLLWFGVRMWDLRVTDLMQGPVYGLETDQTLLDGRLGTIYNYDEIFGTIINRFVVQAIVGFPLTIYGQGGQTRGYLNIQDTIQCVDKSLQVPAERGELRIFNQIMETLSAREIAEIVQRVGLERGHKVTISHVENPRKEAEEHYYNPTYQGLIDIGVVPHFLTDGVVHRLFETVENHREAIRTDIIFKGIKWE